eukprot:TRINITY_DN26507_c0_g1_i5.p1 TRINITY_DN26507_c0_g1~~TRINITY_DN26507_c0_g1_i5.p1  ORF type:complete len:778 (-),score=190.20 TRINITY_DN26507_c0_g1_i5:135-2468(-)
MEMESIEEKSRKQRRKEARLTKKKDRFSSWIHHQKSLKEKKVASISKPSAVETHERNQSLSSSEEGNLNEVTDNNLVEKLKAESNLGSVSEADNKLMKKLKSKSKLGFASDAAPMAKEKRGLKGKSKKTKFEEYMEMEMKRGTVASKEEDLEMERKLAKKLKVKGGKLRGLDDGMNLLFDGIPSLLDSVVSEDETIVAEEDIPIRKSGKKRKKRKLLDSSSKGEGDEGNVAIDDLKKGVAEEANGAATAAVEEPVVEVHKSDVDTKYIAPHLRSQRGGESEEWSQIRRRLRGLLNRLSETNVESVTGEIHTVIQSVSRSAGCQIITEEVLASCLNGPRGNEQYAAVFAAFIAGMGCLVGIDFSAKLLASLAKSFEDEYAKEDALSSRNLTLLLSYLCVFGVCSSDLIYDFLSVLSKRLKELDVSTILTILQCCGMKLRGDDPTAMKDFILDVQNKVNELKFLSGSIPDGQPKINNKRMEFMLETICDIKNNKKRLKEDPAPHTRLKKWLQKLHVVDVLLRGLKWSILLDPDKKGQWWLSGNVTSATDNVVEVASTIDREALEAQKLLNLAAAQRMNTVARKAIFCIIMSGEDYIDAFERILRLDLHGSQDREIIRVLVECCLQEKVFNKYYTALASKLCGHDKNHKVTLKYCVWDHFKELESMELSRSMNLARFVAEMLASFSLSLAVLISVDLSNPKQLTPKRVMHFRMLFEFIFDKPDALLWNIFSRIAAVPEFEMLRNNLEFFVKHYVASTSKSAAGKFKIAKKALNNVSGVLM